MCVILSNDPTDSRLERGWGLRGELMNKFDPPTRVCSEGGSVCVK